MADQAIASAEFREVAEGRLTKNQRLYPLAPFLEGRALYRYLHYKRRYSSIRELDDTGKLPSTFEQTKYCQNLVAAHGSPTASRAVREGNLAVLSWLTGLTHRNADFSSAQLFSKIVHHLRRPGYLGTFAGGTDGGKTNSALVSAGLHLRDQPDAVLATNITSLKWEESSLNERTYSVESRSELEAVADRHEDVVAILDEMSTQANAQTQNYEVNDSFYHIVTFKSKLGLRMFVIGHRESGHDIAPAIREHSTHFIRQVRDARDLEDDVYSAEFYDGIEEGEPFGHQFTLKPMPPVAASYDPDETATFKITE
ncbi:hypothetical protein [Haladaptatus cibarius]|uniref:hypothetical protein n=1 Tax=Haladaptatus cibarius TaxID=453847 RepID=UPI000679B115|nr:hypothetical protein [Haladaptatus cibarius]